MQLRIPVKLNTLPTPLRVLLGLWLIGALVLIVTGQSGYLLLITAANLAYLALTWLSLRVAGPDASGQPLCAAPAALAPRARLFAWLQTGFLLLIILLVGLNAFRPAFSVPLWNDLVAWLGALGERTLPAIWVGGPANAVANPVTYCLIPLVVLLALGANFRELGFGPGQRSWRVCAVWLAIPVLAWVVLMVAGTLAPQVLARRLIGNTLQNGFFEEFLFRGALQTRLRKLVSPLAALITQALIFGVWHVATNARQLDGTLLTGLAACLVSQTIFGLVAGLLFQRTRNLLASSVMHVAVNTLQMTIG